MALILFPGFFLWYVADFSFFVVLGVQFVPCFSVCLVVICGYEGIFKDGPC
jgi:hypothetical protein